MARKKTMGTVENGLANATGCGYADMMQVGTIFNNATPFLLSLNWVQLANTYKSNGFTKTAVDLPVSDAFRNGGFEIDSNTLDAEEILRLKETMSDYGDIETLKECLRWGRLYGGGAVIVSTEQDSTTPFNPTTIKGKEVKLYAVDRWQLSPNGANIQLADNFLLTDNRNTGAITFDKSRVMLYTGQTQPYYLRNQLQGWGTSIFEAIIPQLNQYLKANSVILELLDEAKIDIIKINGLADTLASAGGDTAIRKRLEIASNNKNYKSMLAMDANDDYQQKQLTFGGLDRLLEKIFLLICSCLRIPYSKVFGRGASGFSSGEDDLENYNSMIDADIRVPATKILKQIIDIRCCQLFGRKIPDLIIKWKPLRVLSEKEEQEIKTSKINSYMQLFQAGIMTKKQVAEKLTNEQIIMFSDDEISNLEEEITEDVMTETKENEKEEEKKESILKKIKNALDDDIIWRTVRGNHIPIKKGKNVREAIREFFENKKREKARIKTDYQQILDFVNDNNKKNITQEDILNKVLADEDFKYSKSEVLRRIKKADEYNRNVVTTDVYHKNPKTGKYYPDRKEKHKEILREIFANADNAKPEKGQKPIFTVLGGRGGSGKSKFKGLVYNPEKTIVLDADAIKEKLPEYKGYNAFEVHEESSDILNDALRLARRMGLNVVLDGTMKTEKSIKSKLDDFVKKGYEIEMYYMHLPREISAQRAVGRFMGESGRYVPLDVLLGMKENENNFDKLKKYAKKWAFYDNNVATKETPPKLIEKNY